MAKRVSWIDVAKFIGIFCIVLGHLGTSAGHAYQFVFMFHIALFFFLAGCTDSFDNRNIKEYLINKILKLFIPFLFFGIIFIIVSMIRSNAGIPTLWPKLIDLSKGLLKSTGYGGLWFISCLFCMSIFFKLLKTLVKNKYILLIICGIISFVSFIFFKKHIFWNIDLALEYMFVYCLGFVFFDKINKLFNKRFKTKGKIIYFLVYIILCCFAVMCFYNFKTLSHMFEFNKYVNIIFVNYLRPILLILFVIITSRFFEKSNSICAIGKSTLFICCSENIAKLFLVDSMRIIGVDINISNNYLGAYIYSLIIIIFIYKILYPYELFLLNKIYELLGLNKNHKLFKKV